MELKIVCKYREPLARLRFAQKNFFEKYVVTLDITTMMCYHMVVIKRVTTNNMFHLEVKK